MLQRLFQKSPSTPKLDFLKVTCRSRATPYRPLHHLHVALSITCHSPIAILHRSVALPYFTPSVPDQAPALLTLCSAVYLLVHTYTEARLCRDGEPSPAPGTPSHSRSLLEPGGWAAAKPYATHTLHSHRPSACLAGPDKCARHLDHPWCTRRHTLSASNDQIPGQSHSSHLLPFELSSRLPTGVSILEPLPLASFILASWANATSLCILCNRSVHALHVDFSDRPASTTFQNHVMHSSSALVSLLDSQVLFHHPWHCPSLGRPPPSTYSTLPVLARFLEASISLLLFVLRSFCVKLSVTMSVE